MSFGNYDYKKGGHLILWDLGITIEFPPHSTILIPSVLLSTATPQYRWGELWSTIMQYNSVGLFWWVTYNFMLRWLGETLGVKPESWWAMLKHMFSKII